MIENESKVNRNRIENKSKENERKSKEIDVCEKCELLYASYRLPKDMST